MEQPEATPVLPEATATTPHEDEAAAPRGAFIFVMLMLAGYFVYWFAMWFTVFVERGGG
ncbi:MAG: hypothetical protein JW910_13250 [Anaerolineae bacterium]|nr:hypothetical protein [Anaerolineae bacterium]